MIGLFLKNVKARPVGVGIRECCPKSAKGKIKNRPLVVVLFLFSNRRQAATRFAPTIQPHQSDRGIAATALTG
jgi:hypothetical protein